MKITLLMPKAVVEGMPYDFSIGIGYLSAVLKRAGHSASILNLNHYDFSTEKLIQRIRADQPDIVGIGGMSFSYILLKQYISLAKIACPDATTIVGGVIITSQPNIVFDGLGADIAVIGEAEETVVELAEVLSGNGHLSEVNGIIYRDTRTGEPITTPPRALIHNLDSLPWPDYEGMEMDKFVDLRGNSDNGGVVFSHLDDPRMLPVMTSRGCPFKCTFCCYELVETRYRTRSLDDVMAEIEYLTDRFKINTLLISDDLFSPKKSRMTEFCERIGPMNLNWQCSIRVKPADRDMLALMRDSGCKTVSYGIESASPAVLSSMKKKITVAEIDEALKITHEVGLGIGGNLIFGDPAETEKTAMESVKWFAGNPQYIIRMAMIGFHPGSIIYNDAVARGLIKDKIEFLENNVSELNGTEIPDDAYAELGSLIKFLNHTIGITGKITSVTERAGDLMRVVAVCPHCRGSNTYKKVYKRQNIIYWISCRQCNRRYKLPMIIVDEITLAIAESCEHPEAGTDKLTAYREMAKKPFVHHNILSELGKLYLSGGSLAEAVAVFKTCLRINPHSPDYQRQYAAALSRDEDNEFTRVHENQAQQLEEAGVENTLFIAVDQDIRLDALLKDAVGAHQGGNLDYAETGYRKVLMGNPYHAGANHLLGVIAHQKGEHHMAVDLITKALISEPDNAEAHNNLGAVLNELGNMDEAVASYDKALIIRPDYAEAHFNLGNLLRELGQLDEAVTCYRKALAIRPDYAGAHKNLNLVLKALESASSRAPI